MAYLVITVDTSHKMILDSLWESEIRMRVSIRLIKYSQKYKVTIGIYVIINEIKL